MANPVIPAEAVEAAAGLILQGDTGACECRRSIFDKHDVNPPCSTRRQALRTARAALEAAAPYMMAGDRAAEGRLLAMAWNEGAMAALANPSARLVNPYRSAK